MRRTARKKVAAKDIVVSSLQPSYDSSGRRRVLISLRQWRRTVAVKNEIGERFLAITHNRIKFQETNSFGWYNNTVKIRQSQLNIYTLFWCFDLITRSLSEEAGIQLARKVIEPWIETMAVISWATPTTAFLMRQLIVASRLGRTEYQLLLMEISWWDWNAKIRYKCLVVIDEFLTGTQNRVSSYSVSVACNYSNWVSHLEPYSARLPDFACYKFPSVNEVNEDTRTSKAKAWDYNGLTSCDKQIMRY